MKIFRVANESGGMLCRLEGQRFVPLTDEPLEDLLTRGIKIPDASGPSLEFGSEDFGLSAPIRPGKIVAIGLNYRDHIQETGLDEPEAPLVFTKFTSSVIGPDAPIVIDRSLTERVDWEVELGVILGKPLSRASEDEAV